MPGTNVNDLLTFLELVGQLKHIKRTGWLNKDLDDCETISGHMYRMAMMTFLLDDNQPIDKNRCLQIAVVHDLAECIVGDITPACGIPEDEKHRREEEAMKDIAKLIGSTGDEIFKLYLEYANASTPEAKFVKELDKFDFLLQAYEYEKRDNTPMRFQEFYDNVKIKFTNPLIIDLLDEVKKRRTQINGQ